MERATSPPKDNKLLLMYIFQRVGAMTNLQAIRFVIENEIMDYLDLQLTLAELTDGGFMQVLSVDDNRYYTLTSQAQETLSYFSRRIPASRREWVDKAAETWRDIFRRERLLTSDYRRTAAGDYTVRLTARESGRVIVDIQLSVASSHQAKHLCKTWDKKASEAYKVLMDALLQDDAGPSEGESPEEDERLDELNENNL